MANAAVSLLPQVLDLKLYAGDGVSLSITVSDEDGPVDLTGLVEAQIRDKRQGGAITESFAVQVVDVGLVLLSLTGTQTTGLLTTDPFKGVWDVQWTATGGEPRTLVQGNVSVTSDVTR